MTGNQQRQNPEQTVRLAPVVEEHGEMGERIEVRPDAGQKPDESQEIDWQERALRLQAEMENYRKRIAQRYAQDLAAARHQILQDVLPLADHLELAIEHSQDLERHPTSEGARRFRQNLEATLRAFLDTLQAYQVQPIEAMDQPFDPERHEAVGEITDATVPEGHVAQVVRTGYTEDGRLLRPARVLVNRREG